jgi:hypothetical protein
MRIEIKKVTAWMCVRCGALHTTEAKAHECCACEKCGGRFDRAGSYSQKCDGCLWGERVRDARASIRRHKESVDGSERTLAHLLANKPKKASLTAIALLALSLLPAACATAPRPPAPVETVGSLSPSYRSIATAPVHAGTDLATNFQAVDSDDAPVTVGAGEAAAPDVVAKGGLVLGAAR